MTDARFRVLVAGPLVSVQDAGRFGHLRFGVPASGPMDRLSHAAANVALGNPANATAIEVSVGGVTLECLSGSVTLAIAGGGFAVHHGARLQSAWSVFTVKVGDRVSVNAGKWGSWAYVAFAGVLDVASWLGSTATHSLSGLGGGMLGPGYEVLVESARTSESRDGPIPIPAFAQPPSRVRVVPGPQQHHFEPEAITTLTSTAYAFSGAYDRMGVRLDGERLALRSALSIPSEPIIRGAIQVAGDGVPTVLFADHQTTGGYPKIASVLSSDLDQMVQFRPGDEFEFETVAPAEAIAITRSRHDSVSAYLEVVAKPRTSLDRRLYGENLIGGVVSVREADRSDGSVVLPNEA